MPEDNGKKGKPIELKIDVDSLKEMGREKKKKLQKLIGNIDFEGIKDKASEKKENLQDKMNQVSSNGRKKECFGEDERGTKDSKVESFICENCGASMEMIEDELHHRQIVCPACGAKSSVYDSDKDRVKREKADQAIYEMQYARKHPVKKRMKILIPILILFSFAIILSLVGKLSDNSDSTSSGSQLKPPISASEVKGKNYADVKLSFENAGFTNIQTEPLRDLVVGWLKDDGDVEEVSVNGSTDYSTSKTYEKDVPVIIRYHTYASSSNTDSTKSSEKTSTEESPSEEQTQKENSTTVSQKNALKSAKSYLKYMAFSYSGLVAQLEYEGYSTEDATYAVDNCGANWNEQDSKKAQEYLDFTSFSRSGLIDQLLYEGFTEEQAVYGVDSVGL